MITSAARQSPFLIAARNASKISFPRTRFRPDTRLDRGGHDVGSSGGSDGRGIGVALRRGEWRAGGEPRGALERAPQGAGGAQVVAGRVAGSAGAGDEPAGWSDRFVA